MRGFSLIEAMAALGVAALTGTLAVSGYQTGVAQAGAGDREWIAFTLAQQKLEMLAAVPRTSPALADLVPDVAAPGSAADASCDGGADGGGRVDASGNAVADGAYELCWKVTDHHPSGSLKDVRVVAGYVDEKGDRADVVLHTLR